MARGRPPARRNCVPTGCRLQTHDHPIVQARSRWSRPGAGDDHHASHPHPLTVLLLASLAVAGCWIGQADEPTTPAAQPPASTAAPHPPPQPAPVRPRRPPRPGRPPGIRSVLAPNPGAPAPSRSSPPPSVPSFTRFMPPPIGAAIGWCSTSTGWVGSAMSRWCTPTPRTGQSRWPGLAPSRSRSGCRTSASRATRPGGRLGSWDSGWPAAGPPCGRCASPAPSSTSPPSRSA
jgi:hypothetical protein